MHILYSYYTDLIYMYTRTQHYNMICYIPLTFNRNEMSESNINRNFLFLLEMSMNEIESNNMRKMIWAEKDNVCKYNLRNLTVESRRVPEKY